MGVTKFIKGWWKVQRNKRLIKSFLPGFLTGLGIYIYDLLTPRISLDYFPFLMIPFTIFGIMVALINQKFNRKLLLKFILYSLFIIPAINPTYKTISHHLHSMEFPGPLIVPMVLGLFFAYIGMLGLIDLFTIKILKGEIKPW